MNFNSDTVNKFREILNMEPGDTVKFAFGEVICHLGNHGKYIDIYDANGELKGKIQISLYDNYFDFGFDICDIIFG